ncbi:hypothetical protein NQ038_03785 [Brevibacterium sp. 50QC2O2]|jgi:hypothetical protein|uniref:hypothetical protein n=1 Tax=Brevibacterium TaxID=1696 RepID=UPI00211BAC38|nr:MULTISPECIES: hypothetical protein [unclassified Brevibacterium]MCQ9369089.1 hypothetical protein [Brevibacterium sp. 91QC2O2]MCQ9385065.1 hypothetical protein [Brevibacterium sp. 68QC2CO]MCQ9387763.1 hypothetical protein [Brevibacterium sp. 50QC2O2]
MRHSKLTTVSALLASATLLLSACGGTDDKPAEQAASQAPAGAASQQAGDQGGATAEGEKYQGSEYSFNVPKGWKKAKNANADIAFADSKKTDGFASNLNINSTGGMSKLTADDVESQAPGQLQAGGGKDVKVGERATVAGEQVAHISANMDVSGIEYAADQFYLVHGDKAHILTISTPTGFSAEQRAELSESILNTWAWK